MNWYLEALKKYAVFGGRARRKEYWYFVLFNIIISFGLMIIDRVTGTYSPNAHIGLLHGIYTFAVLIPSIAVSVRRLHDTDHSGWWQIYPISLIVLSGVIFAISKQIEAYDQQMEMTYQVIFGLGIISAIVGIIIGIVLFYFMVQDSQQGENQYGPNPKVTVESSRGATTEEHGTRTRSPTPVLFQGGEGDIASSASKQQSVVNEERIYAAIAIELETGVTDKGLWTRLFAECGGDEKQTKVLYIKQRAERLIANERLRLEQLARESAERSRIEKLANAAERERLEEQEKRERAIESALGITDVKNMDAFKLYNKAYNLYDTKKYDKAEIICNYLFDKFPNSMQATWAKNIIGRIKSS